MKKLLNCGFVAACLSWSLCSGAQDARDEAIFGEKPSPGFENQSAPTAEVDIQKNLKDTLEIGARIEYRIQSSNAEHQKLTKSSFSELKEADLYFDARPIEDLRAFLKFRLREDNQVPGINDNSLTGDSCENCVNTQLDQLWFKWDMEDSIFFTFGKQQLKWGSGRFWNPTDYTASEIKDPFALNDRRLGREMLKIHFPQEKQAFNYYAVIQMDDAQRNDDLGLAFRGEFAFGGSGEAAASIHKRKNSPFQFGLDISSALGVIDVYTENSLSRGHQRDFYKGSLDPETFTLPETYKDEKKLFTQSVLGSQYSYKYSDDDFFSFGVEYFYNEMGYDDRELELYSLFLGQSKSLYSGKQYAGAYLVLPQPGLWNETSFYFNLLRNFSDKTMVLRLTGTFELYKFATVEGFVSRCFGDYGELCFRVPREISDVAATLPVPAKQREAIALLPTERILYVAGAAIYMNF